MLCEYCKFECGYWECGFDWEEYYVWECKKGLSPCTETETCESYEKVENDYNRY